MKSSERTAKLVAIDLKDFIIYTITFPFLTLYLNEIFKENLSPFRFVAVAPYTDLIVRT